jgi:ribonuclease HI
MSASRRDNAIIVKALKELWLDIFTDPATVRFLPAEFQEPILLPKHTENFSIIATDASTYKHRTGISIVTPEGETRKGIIKNVSDNSKGELFAILMALWVAKIENPLTIYSDSESNITLINSYLADPFPWLPKKTAYSAIIKFVINIIRQKEESGAQVTLIHVKSHQRDGQEPTWGSQQNPIYEPQLLNKMADELAKAAVQGDTYIAQESYRYGKEYILYNERHEQITSRIVNTSYKTVIQGEISAQIQSGIAKSGPCCSASYFELPDKCWKPASRSVFKQSKDFGLCVFLNNLMANSLKTHSNLSKLNPTVFRDDTCKVCETGHSTHVDQLFANQCPDLAHKIEEGIKTIEEELMIECGTVVLTQEEINEHLFSTENFMRGLIPNSVHSLLVAKRVHKEHISVVARMLQPLYIELLRDIYHLHTRQVHEKGWSYSARRALFTQEYIYMSWDWESRPCSYGLPNTSSST